LPFNLLMQFRFYGLFFETIHLSFSPSIVCGCQTMKRFYCFLIALFFLPVANAETQIVDIQVGRYSSVSTEPTLAQRDLLASMVEVTFPASVITVESALQNLLLNSGYGLASRESSDPRLPILLNQPLPLAHRSLGPMPLKTALQVLAGSPWELVIDPVHRLVSFDLTEAFNSSTQ